MESQQFEEQLAAAMETRPVIEQAKGAIAAVRCATPDQAYAELRHVSQRHNVKLNALAAAVVEVAAGREAGDAELERVVWQEWGDVLPRC